MKFVCPSCGRTNTVPDIWHGNCFVCRKCETQVTAPTLANARVRSWLASPGWLAVVGSGVLLLGGGVLLTILSLTVARTSDLPVLERAGEHAPQLALPGGTLAVEWDPGIASVGGYFRIVRQDVQLIVEDGRSFILEVRARPKPWPPTLIDSTGGPETAPVPLWLEVALPARDELEGSMATLRTGVQLEYPVRNGPGLPVELGHAEPTHEERFTFATAEQAAILASRGRIRGGAFIGAVACGLLAAAIAIAAFASAEKTITVICPECGRATDATFTHARGAIHVTPCPHRRD